MIHTKEQLIVKSNALRSELEGLHHKCLGFGNQQMIAKCDSILELFKELNRELLELEEAYCREE